MIVTVTANPAIDLAFSLSQLDVSSVNRATSENAYPAGKGINVSRALAQNGLVTVALFPGDERNGGWVQEQLNDDGVETILIGTRTGVRTNVTIDSLRDGTTTINSPGAPLSNDEQDALVAGVVSAMASRPEWLVLAGSLPLEVDDGFYANIAALAHDAGVRVAVDTSGDALARVSHAGVADFFKPNHAELCELAGKSLERVGEVIDFARTMLRDDRACAMVSLGSHGALLVTRGDALWAGASAPEVVTTVGAGDCSLAGYLAADVACRAKDIGGREGNVIRLTTAVAWGTAKVQLVGTTVPGPEHIHTESVRCVEELNLDMKIEDLIA